MVKLIVPPQWSLGHQSLEETGTIIDHDHATELENIVDVDVNHIEENLPSSSPMQTEVAADKDARPSKKIRKKGHQSLEETGTIIDHDHATELENNVDVNHIEENLPSSLPMQTDVAADKDARPSKKIRKKGHQSLEETGTIIDHDHTTELENIVDVDVNHIEENLPSSSPMQTDVAADKDARPSKKIRKKGMTIKTKHRKYLPLATGQPSISGIIHREET
ncbi:unnamed protein product [Mytilus edulis]|uniref:Uncharacterized protein n=1 Tax=Mytilus edulis TaxID=6550 RepID=A0A8S3R588_MYTED|nr:unnamed protein product [Mytilus edulis]